MAGRRTAFRSLTAVFACLLFLASTAAHAEFTASVDRTVIDENDALVLELRLDDQVFVDNPDLTGLEQDFTQIGPPVRSSQLMIMNGQRSSNTTWTITLQPKRRGTLRIPSIRYKGEHTDPITITVTEPTPQEQAAIDRTVRLETEVSEDSVWVQEQFLYTVRLYYASNTVLFGDLPPAPKIDDAVVQTIGDSRPGSVVRNGIRYNMVEQRYAVVPQRSGTLTIDPETFSGAIRIAEGGQTRRKNIRIASDPIDIEVKPQPASWPAGVPWLPARNLTLTQSWSAEPDALRAGEPVTRTINLSATGVAASALPEIDEGSAGNAHVYPDQPTLDEGMAAGNFVATRIQSATLIPDAEGPLRLPEIEVRWWDVDGGRMRTATLAAQDLHVGAAPPGTTVTPPPPSRPVQAPDATGSKAPPSAQSETPDSRRPGADRTLAALRIAAVILTLLVIAFLAWRIARRRTTRVAMPQQPDRPVVPQDPEQALRRACAAHDPAAARTALARWRRQVPLDEDESATLDVLTGILDAAMFSGAQAQRWNGDALARWLAERPARQKARRRNARPPALPPLHPRT